MRQSVCLQFNFQSKIVSSKLCQGTVASLSRKTVMIKRANKSNGPPDGPQEVEFLLKQAKDALQTAEKTVQKIDKLPSAYPSNELLKTVGKKAVKLLLGVGLVYVMYQSQRFGFQYQWAGGVLAGILLALRGTLSGSLSLSGGLAAALVGGATCSCGLRLGATMLAFYYSSTMMTRWGEEYKLKLGLQDYKKDGQRGWPSVVSTAGLPAIAALVCGYMAGYRDLPFSAQSPVYSALLAFYCSYFACSCGDTWASELGVLSSQVPRLITDMRPVRPGTNGAITVHGLIASVMGGLSVGAVFYGVGCVSPTAKMAGVTQEALKQTSVIALAAFAGLLGSLIDSLLGATVQFTGYHTVDKKIVGKPGVDVDKISGLNVLDNNMVNVVSSTITAIVGAIISLFLI